MNPSNMPSDHDREAVLFAMALEKSIAERPAFLAAMCGENDALHRRLEALLSGHGQRDSLLERPDNANLPTIKLDTAPEPPDEAVGQTLGRYKLLEQIGVLEKLPGNLRVPELANARAPAERARHRHRRSHTGIHESGTGRVLFLSTVPAGHGGGIVAAGL